MEEKNISAPNNEQKGYIPSFPVQSDNVRGGFIPSPAPVDIAPTTPPPPSPPTSSTE